MLKYGYLIVAATSAILAAAPAHAGLRTTNLLNANALNLNILIANTLSANVVSPAGEIGRVVAVELPRR